MEELETAIEGIVINGVDIIKFSDDGQLMAHLKLLVRPVEAIKLFQCLTGEQLARQ